MARTTADPHIRLNVSVKRSLYVRLPKTGQKLSARVSDLLEIGLAGGQNKGKEPNTVTHSGIHWGPGAGLGPGEPINFDEWKDGVYVGSKAKKVGRLKR